MRKKLLTSLVAMSAVFGFAYAAVMLQTGDSGYNDVYNWYTTYIYNEPNLLRDTKAADLTINNIEAISKDLTEAYDTYYDFDENQRYTANSWQQTDRAICGSTTWKDSPLMTLTLEEQLTALNTANNELINKANSLKAWYNAKEETLILTSIDANGYLACMNLKTEYNNFTTPEKEYINTIWKKNRPSELSSYALTANVNRLVSLCEAYVGTVADLETEIAALPVDCIDAINIANALKSYWSNYTDCYESLKSFEAVKDLFEGDYEKYNSNLETSCNYINAATWVNLVNEADEDTSSSDLATIDSKYTDLVVESLRNDATVKSASKTLTSLIAAATVKDYYTTIETVWKSLSDKQATYALVDTDLNLDGDFNPATTYGQLSAMKEALTALGKNVAEANCEIEGYTKANVAVMNEMMLKQAAMKEAIEYISAVQSIYYKDGASVPATLYINETTDDYAKYVEVSVDLQNYEKYSKLYYVAQRFTPTKISALEVPAIAAYKEYAKPILAQSTTTDFYKLFKNKCLKAGYEAKQADYKATKGKKTTVRDAINKYNTLIDAEWNEQPTYDNVAYIEEKLGKTYSSEVSALTIETSEKAEIGSLTKTNCAGYYDTLVQLIEDAAKIDFKTVKLLPELETIYTDNFVDPTTNYDEKAVKALKDAYAVKNAALTAAGKIGVAKATTTVGEKTYNSTCLYYTIWNIDGNFEYEVFETLAALNEEHAGYATNNKSDANYYQKVCWGYNVVTDFQKNESEYKPWIQAMKDASKYLVDYTNIIWPEVEVTSELSVLAGKADKAYKSYADKAEKEDPAGLNSHIIAYLDPIAESTQNNIIAATGDVLPFDVVGVKLTIYQGNTTVKTIPYSASMPETQKNYFTSSKALNEYIQTLADNSIVYINAEYSGNLPANVACYKTATKDYRATEIKVIDGQDFHYPFAIAADRATLTKDVKTYNSPLFCPFDVEADDLSDLLSKGIVVNYMDAVTEGTDNKGEPTIRVFLQEKTSTDKLFGMRPYIISGDANKTIEIVAKNTTVRKESENTPVTSNSTKKSFTLSGVSKKVAIETDLNTWYISKSTGNFGRLGYDKDGFIQYGELAAGRVKFVIAGASGPDYNVSFDSESEEGETTGIEDINVDNVNAVDGIYTITGVKVNNMERPGVYIVNGKKVMVK